jgi:hypothetical protein
MDNKTGSALHDRCALRSKTEIGAGRFMEQLDISPAASSTTGGNRYGKANEHNGWVPRDVWLEEWTA